MTHKTFSIPQRALLPTEQIGLEQILERVVLPRFCKKPLRVREIIFEIRRHDPALILNGGAVRDVLSNRVPFDLDFSTSMEPNELKNILIAAFGNLKPYVRIKEEISLLSFGAETSQILDFTPFKYRSGKGLEASLSADSMSRDFSVNAMYCCPVEKIVYDPTGGEKDLSERILKLVACHQHLSTNKTISLRVVKFLVRGYRATDALLELLHRRIASDICAIGEQRFTDWILRHILARGDDAGQFLDLCSNAISDPKVREIVGQARKSLGAESSMRWCEDLDSARAKYFSHKGNCASSLHLSERSGQRAANRVRRDSGLGKGRGCLSTDFRC